jgi:hypothetical protein
MFHKSDPSSTAVRPFCHASVATLYSVRGTAVAMLQALSRSLTVALLWPIQLPAEHTTLAMLQPASSVAAAMR